MNSSCRLDRSNFVELLCYLAFLQIICKCKWLAARCRGTPALKRGGYVKARMVMSQLDNDVGRPRCKLYVCTSCREKGTPREPEENRAGFKLFRELKHTVASSSVRDEVEVLATPCLSICPRPCGIAISLNGSWTYLFGDQAPKNTSDDIIHGLSLYLQSPQGLMPRDRRPYHLRRSILGRVPPGVGAQTCT